MWRRRLNDHASLSTSELSCCDSLFVSGGPFAFCHDIYDSERLNLSINMKSVFELG